MSDLNTTASICLIAKHDRCIVQKTVSKVEILHLSVSSSITPAIKSISIDDDVECFENIFVDDDKIGKDIYSSSKLPRLDVRSVQMEDMTDTNSSKDLKSSTHEGIESFGNGLEQNVGDEESLTPVSTYLHDTCKPVLDDLRSSIDNEHVAEYNGETSADKISSEPIIEPITNFSQESDTDFLQVDSSNHNYSSAVNQGPKQHFDLVTEQDEKITMAFPMQAKESTHNEETINKNLLEENRSSFSVTANVKSNTLDTIEGTSYDIRWETRDISIDGSESQVVDNQQNVQKRIGAASEDPIIDNTASMRSSFARLIHDESGLLEAASFSGPMTTSGHIPYSGNVSHRSDSSTTSTQSFAFPILQSEWNSSPVKMAKADRRRLRKRRWREIFCCKF